MAGKLRAASVDPAVAEQVYSWLLHNTAVRARQPAATLLEGINFPNGRGEPQGFVVVSQGRTQAILVGPLKEIKRKRKEIRKKKEKK